LAAKHLLALINDILDISKLEAGRIELCPETFEADWLVDGLVTTVQPLVAKNSNALEVERVGPADPAGSLGTMHTDPTRLRQCLLNLLSNACKFTEKGRITLSARREERDGQDWLTFAVRDTGIGMTPQEQAKLFQAFVQVDISKTRKYGGTGLGLAISRRLIEMMGGTIDVKSEHGQGSTFTLSLPADVRATRPSDAPSPPEPGERGNTVLVVDDGQAERDLLDRLLTREGFRVVALERGEEAVRVAREVRPVAITLDVSMPGMDGWAVLTALKADPGTADIPVVMLSIVDDRNLGQALGASECLTKPIDFHRLLGLLKRFKSGATGDG
jgi:CheY-like chemotaxis protein